MSTKHTWRDIILSFLILGIAVTFVLYLLGEMRITPKIRIGILHLNDQEQQSYLLNVKALSPADLMKKLKNLAREKVNFTQQGILTSLYKATFLDQEGVLRSYQSIKQVDLSQLDQMVFTAQQSNSQRSRDRWSINVFCSQKKQCITERAKRYPEDEKQSKISNTGLLEVEGTENTRLVLAVLHRLIKLHGGKTELQQTKYLFFYLDT